jgi:hypothetical protein
MIWKATVQSMMQSHILTGKTDTQRLDTPRHSWRLKKAGTYTHENLSKMADSRSHMCEEMTSHPNEQEFSIWTLTRGHG